MGDDNDIQHLAHSVLSLAFELVKKKFHYSRFMLLLVYCVFYVPPLVGFLKLYNFITFLQPLSKRLNHVFVDMQYVMIVLKGSVPISFGGTEQPAAYGELVSIGGLSPDVNKKLSAAIAAILESKLSVPKSRFFLKFYDTKASHLTYLSFQKKGH